MYISSLAVDPLRRGAQIPDFAEPFGRLRAFFFSSGRCALLAGFKTLAPLRRVWIPALFCRSVIPAIKEAGLLTALYDIDDRFCPDLSGVEYREGDAIIVVHYFGIANGLGPALKLFGRRAVIEDCAHALVDGASSRCLGSEGSVAVFSPRKQIPVSDGGVLVINDQSLCFPEEAPRRAVLLSRKDVLAAAERIAFAVGFNMLMVKDALRARIGGADAAFSLDLTVGASARTQKIFRALDWPVVIQRKQSNYRFLSERLNSASMDCPFPELPEGSVPQFFPVRVPDSRNVCLRLRRQGIGALCWPAEEGLEGISPERFPGAARWLRQGLCLPIHENLTQRNLDRVAQSLARELS